MHHRWITCMIKLYYFLKSIACNDQYLFVQFCSYSKNIYNSIESHIYHSIEIDHYDNLHIEIEIDNYLPIYIDADDYFPVHFDIVVFLPNYIDIENYFPVYIDSDGYRLIKTDIDHFFQSKSRSVKTAWSTLSFTFINTDLLNSYPIRRRHCPNRVLSIYFGIYYCVYLSKVVWLWSKVLKSWSNVFR